MSDEPGKQVPPETGDDRHATTGSPREPAWQRLLARPRRLHRLATGALALAALVAGLDSFARSTPGGLRPDLLALTYLFDAIAWGAVLAGAIAEAFVAGLAAPRLRADGRPHYLIVFVTGFFIAALFCGGLGIFATAPGELTLAGRLVKALLAGLLPLVTGVALAAGGTLIWVTQLRPRLEARLEAEIRAYEARKHAG